MKLMSFVSYNYEEEGTEEEKDVTRYVPLSGINLCFIVR